MNSFKVLQKTSDTGPSFSEAVSSCSTFSSPFTTACCSSANAFSCNFEAASKLTRSS
uniref:Uncharacterized protein n=1 Tax=Arundo donax TaxID=35708 RepID=A0A0A9DSK4_ARUDO